LLENGADLPTIQVLMEHADLEATSSYSHLSRPHLEKTTNPPRLALRTRSREIAKIEGSASPNFVSRSRILGVGRSATS
jgi:hypothetical protein